MVIDQPWGVATQTVFSPSYTIGDLRKSILVYFYFIGYLYFYPFFANKN